MKNYKRAICYSGYRNNQSPKTCDYPTKAQILEDLRLLEKDFDALRMYDPSENAVRTLQVIRENHFSFKVMLGIDLTAEYNNLQCAWLKRPFTETELKENFAYNEYQLRKLISLANEYEDIIEFISVGNEALPTWKDHVVSEERLVYFAEELKKNCSQPVTYNDGFDIYLNKIPKLAEKLDLFSLHIYPQWMGMNLKDSIQFFQKAVEEVRQKYPDKPICITETGWATNSNNRQMIPEDANLENHIEYIKFITKWSKENQMTVYLFEAYDEPWKGSDQDMEPEKHWGLYSVDRKPKWDFTGKLFR